MRVTNGKPTSLATLREAVDVIRELANGRSVDYHGSTVKFPWGSQSSLEVWVAAYGPKALAARRRGRRRVHLAAGRPRHRPLDDRGRARTPPSGAGRDPGALSFCVAAPAYVGDDLAHQRDQCRWFGGMVGNHVADIVERYGEDPSVEMPVALTEYIKGRKGYDYAEHGRVGNTHADFVPDEVIERFCILGPAATHVARLEELREIGVTQFALYLQHDAKIETLEAYGEAVIPAVNGTLGAAP